MNTPTHLPASEFRKACAAGLLAAAVFSLTFVLNRFMADDGGHWAWSAALRFLMMAPVLVIILAVRGRLGGLRAAWNASPAGWVLQGSVGAALFYAPLVAAGAYAPAWLIAGTWPVAIVIGMLLSPLLYRDHRRRIPRRALAFSIIVVAGVALLRCGHADDAAGDNVRLAVVLVLLSATAHPVGNRGGLLLMEKHGLPQDPYVRLTAMIIGATPCWIGLCLFGHHAAGFPSPSQWGASGAVALCGCVATPLFYGAVARVRNDGAALAAVEATQAAESPFALIIGSLTPGFRPPGPTEAAGLALVVIGLIAHARTAGPESAPAETSA